MIYRDPLLNLKDFLIQKNNTWDGSLELRAFARQALCEGMLRIGIHPNDSVIVPAYICHDAIQCMIQSGIRVRFCEVDTQLKMEPNRIVACSDSSTRALLFVRYFGIIPIPLTYRSLCREKGWLLIEDNAHGLPHTTLPMDPDIHLSVHGLRKIIPAPTGAILCVKGCGEKQDKQDKQCLLNRTDAGFVIKTAFKKIYSRVFRKQGSKLVSYRQLKCGKAKPNQENEHPNSEISKTMTPLSRHSWDHCQPSEIIRKRQMNYMRLSNLLSANRSGILTLLREKIDPESCPMAMPVKISEKCNEFVEFLTRSGYEAYRWPTLPADVAGHPAYPIANQLESSMALLPIHQDMSNQTIEKMAETILSWTHINHEH
jgi:hypothetical protein